MLKRSAGTRCCRSPWSEEYQHCACLTEALQLPAGQFSSTPNDRGLVHNTVSGRGVACDVSRGGAFTTVAGKQHCRWICTSLHARFQVNEFAILAAYSIVFHVQLYLVESCLCTSNIDGLLGLYDC